MLTIMHQQETQEGESMTSPLVAVESEDVFTTNFVDNYKYKLTSPATTTRELLLLTATASAPSSCNRCVAAKRRVALAKNCLDSALSLCDSCNDEEDGDENDDFSEHEIPVHDEAQGNAIPPAIPNKQNTAHESSLFKRELLKDNLSMLTLELELLRNKTKRNGYGDYSLEKDWSESSWEEEEEDDIFLGM